MSGYNQYSGYGGNPYSGEAQGGNPYGASSGGAAAGGYGTSNPYGSENPYGGGDYGATTMVRCMDDSKVSGGELILPV